MNLAAASQVRFDPRRLHQRSLLLLLRAAEATLLPAASVSVPSRVLYLPLAWEDPATLGAVARYAETVRATARRRARHGRRHHHCS